MAKNNGFGNMDFTQIMLQQAYKAIDEPVYCRYCGKDIQKPSEMSTQDHDGRWHSDWEAENNAHIKCYNKHYYVDRGRR